MTVINADAVRRDFPVLGEWVYLDNAFVGLMPRQVKEGYEEYVEQWYRFNTSGDRTILQEWLAKAGKVRGMVAGFIGVSAEEVAFEMCTGSGLNVVVNGTDWRRGDNVVFPEWEHNPPHNYTTRRHGVEPRVWHPRGDAFEVGDLEALIDDRTRLVQVSEVSYVNGQRLDLREVSEVAHEHGAEVLVDSTQAVGALRVDYRRDGVDYVSFAPYKYLMGPAGLSFLYLKREKIGELEPDRVGWKNQLWSGDNPEDPVDLGSAERFEYGTLHFQGMYAVERSLEYLNRVDMANVEKRNLMLSRHLYDGLSGQGKRLLTPRPESTIVSYYQEGAVELAARLKSMKIKVTGRSAHGDHIRVSSHFYNTREDIDQLLENV
ncbi:aminotransferase class V-fold PLP-dependent enzyme [Candidatus Bathyarchaeota archaeon]|nr:aminotransferase class V-fold PLP-dependent enzyme [Candidatus Bathyarchaeota archaeon]